jgi:hypothetical protein
VGHQISAILAKEPYDAAKAKLYHLPVIPLPQSFCLVALHPAHTDFWVVKLQLPDLAYSSLLLDCSVTHFFATELFPKQRYAFIETDYSGGIGQQSAVVYEEGSTIMTVQTASKGPINQALTLLGAFHSAHQDENDHFRAYL